MAVHVRTRCQACQQMIPVENIHVLPVRQAMVRLCCDCANSPETLPEPLRGYIPTNGVLVELTRINNRMITHEHVITRPKPAHAIAPPVAQLAVMPSSDKPRAVTIRLFSGDYATLLNSAVIDGVSLEQRIRNALYEAGAITEPDL